MFFLIYLFSFSF